MLDTYSLTQTIAIFLGLYMLAAGIGLMTDSKAFAGIMTEFKENIGLNYIAAIIAFSLGAVLVAIHNLWSTPLEILVTLVGWAALLEGVLMLAFRKSFLLFAGAMPLNEKFVRSYGIFTMLIAVMLFYMVFA